MRGNFNKGGKSSSAPRTSRSAQKAAENSQEEPLSIKKGTKGKKGKKGKVAEDSEDEHFFDIISETGEMTASLNDSHLGGSKGGMKKSKSNASLSADDYTDVISESCDDITHQKPALRMEAVTNLMKVLRGGNAKEAGDYLLVSYIDTLQTKLVRLLNRQIESSEEEGRKLMELVCLLSLLLGPDEDAFFNALEVSSLNEC